MPVVRSGYKPSTWARNTHLNTIISNKLLLRKKPDFKRIRLETPDKDFMDIDHLDNENSKAAIIVVHGLEGSSSSAYVRELATRSVADGFELFAVNLRGCSGEPNRTYQSYHSGKVDDLDFVIEKISGLTSLPLFIIGYSLGGNIVFKYAGEKTENVPGNILAFAGISVPCHLSTSAKTLEERKNILYLYRFMRSMKEKASHKAAMFPEAGMDLEKIARSVNLRQIDDLYTAPAHGFSDAEDYYSQCSSRPVLKNIRRPALMINALDDTFLSDECYPYTEAKENDSFYLETPRYGGHVGFASGSYPFGERYLETRILGFFNSWL